MDTVCFCGRSLPGRRAFEPTGVPEEVIEEIKQKVKDTRDDLPDGVSAPEVFAFNTAGIPSVIAALQGPEDYRLLQRLG